MTETLLDGIVGRTIQTSRLRASILERPSDQASRVVVFVHGNVSSSLFWQPTMLALDANVRAIAIDLRGFGDSEILPIDATRGVRDFSDDVVSVLDELGIETVNLVGWSMGGGVVLQLLLDHPDRVLSVALVSPISPFGFGGTTGEDGRLLYEDCAGTGGGGANPEFVARLEAHDTTADSPTSPRNVYRTTYVTNPDAFPRHEDVWVDSMLTTATGLDNYPGDSHPCHEWPGFGPGTRGVLNTMTPRYFNVSGIVDLPTKPDILWCRGIDDVIVSDTSLFDINFLGQLGAIPGWPGTETAPPQPMIQQTRAVFDRYAAAGGRYVELAFEGCGHSAHLERPEEFLAALTKHIVAS